MVNTKYTVWRVDDDVRDLSFKFMQIPVDCKKKVLYVRRSVTRERKEAVMSHSSQLFALI